MRWRGEHLCALCVSVLKMILEYKNTPQYLELNRATRVQDNNHLTLKLRNGGCR